MKLVARPETTILAEEAWKRTPNKNRRHLEAILYVRKHQQPCLAPISPYAKQKKFYDL